MGKTNAYSQEQKEKKANEIRKMLQEQELRIQQENELKREKEEKISAMKDA